MEKRQKFTEKEKLAILNAYSHSKCTGVLLHPPQFPQMSDDQNHYSDSNVYTHLMQVINYSFLPAFKRL